MCNIVKEFGNACNFSYFLSSICDTFKMTLDRISHCSCVNYMLLSDALVIFNVIFAACLET